MADAAPLRFSGIKSAERWQNQMRRRGWTEEQIKDALRSGDVYQAVNEVNSAHGAARYVHRDTGRSVVIDTTTREIIHVGGDNFQY